MTEVSRSGYAISKTCTVFYSQRAGNVGSKPIRDMGYFCSIFMCLCCPVCLEALRRADPLSEASWKMFKDFKIWKNRKLYILLVFHVVEGGVALKLVHSKENSSTVKLVWQ